MPNYITNRLKIVGEEKDVQEVLDFLKTEYETEEKGKKVMYIDFNNIIKLPEELLNTPATFGDKKYEELYTANILKYGYKDWYDWCLDNWGTKWNAMRTTMVGNDIIFFETAWAGVPDLISQIAQKFPNLTFYYDFADEDISYNTGKIIYENGVIISEHYPKGGSKEAYELCFDLGNACRESYILVNDNYEWVDIDEINSSNDSI